MKISTCNLVNKNTFGVNYKTEDVLRLITEYPYKGKDSQKIIEDLTGIDIYSKELVSLFPKDALYGICYMSFLNMCTQKVLSQHQELQQVYDSYNPQTHLKEGKSKVNSWFKEQLSKLGATIDIERFKLSKRELEEEYNSLFEIFNKFL